MHEAWWRALAEDALAQMASMGLEPAAEERIRHALEEALALPDGEAAGRIREILEGPEMRDWLREQEAIGTEIGGEPGRADEVPKMEPAPAPQPEPAPKMEPSPAPPIPHAPSAPPAPPIPHAPSAPPIPPAPSAPPIPPVQSAPPGAGAPRGGGLLSRLRDALAPRRREHAPTANGGPPPPPDDFLLGVEESAAESTGELSPTTGAEPEAGVEADAGAGGGNDRVWRADIEGHDPGAVLSADVEHALLIAVATESTGALAVGDFDESVFEADPALADVELTVQVDSDDIEVVGPREQPLVVPRHGPTEEPARFVVRALRDGPCTLTATVHREGNFVTQLTLTVPVGEAGAATMTELGRPPESVAVLEPRDVSLILQPAPAGGYTCIAVGGQAASVHLPITVAELAMAVKAVQDALLEVVRTVDGQGLQVFQRGIDIPEEQSQQALRTMARAGARLFQQLFLHPAAGDDAARLGQWLRDEASSPGMLKVQVVASQVPLPWSMLYLGDAAAGATLDWSHFLGMRHIVEQIPLQPRLTAQDERITSTPLLSVGLNLNLTIDQQFQTTWVADHRSQWATLSTQRRGLALSPRTTRDSVLAALRDPATPDQVLYFYCHASSGGADGNPDQAAIVMGKDDPIRLGDLSLDAPANIQLAGRPLVFLNACESADLDPRFYAGWVPYFMAKGARGVIGTECKTPALFGVRFAEEFFARVLDGTPVGEAALATRRTFLEKHRNPLGLLYAVHCDAGTRVDPALAAAS